MAGQWGLQSLDPWAAHFCLGIEAFTRTLMPCGFQGSPLVVALSGGLDSTALAAILAILAPRLEITLTAAHLDHRLRPESGEDTSHCAALCERLGIGLVTESRDVAELAGQWGTGIEDAGRRARYAWLEEVRAGTGASAIALAHHLGDLAEDQLMRLIRGTGWPALGGMPASDPSRRIVRPLLMTPKAHLERFVSSLGLSWREDASNRDPAFLRNRVRREILPLLVRENPDYLGAAAELWRQARLDEIHWDEEVLRLIPGSEGQAASLTLDASGLDGASKALRLRLYKRAVELLGPGQPLSATLHGLDEAWRNRLTGKLFQFPGGKTARVEREGITFRGPIPSPGVDTRPPEG